MKEMRACNICGTLHPVEELTEFSIILSDQDADHVGSPLSYRTPIVITDTSAMYDLFHMDRKTEG